MPISVSMHHGLETGGGEIFLVLSARLKKINA